MDNQRVARELIQAAREIVSEDMSVEEMTEALPKAKGALEKAIQSALGFKPSFKVQDGSRYVEFIDEGLEGDIGVMGLVIKKLAMNVSFSKVPMSDGSFAAFISLDWQHQTGGSNGSKVGSVWFTPKGRFVIRKA